jgi:hypothetical protein
MKPTKLTNFKFTFHGPMTRQLFDLGGVTPQDTPGYLSVGSGENRYLAITRAIGGFRNTPAAAVINQITERAQMNLQPAWAECESSDEDDTEMFCIIEVEVE